jgi:hypothetical protein
MKTKTTTTQKITALFAALALTLLSACEKEQPAPPEIPAEPPAPFTLNMQLSGVTALAFSEDGAFLASGFADGSFAFWRIADGERTVFLQSAADLPAAADAAGLSLWNQPTEAEAGATVSALNREKTRLASGYADGSIVLKDAATGKELARFITSEGGEWISITPKGYFNASAKGGEIVKLEAGEETYSMSRLSEVFRRPDLYEAAVSGKEVAGLSATEVVADTQNQPPLVEIPGPKTLSVRADTAEVKLRVTERGGGAGRLVVYHNGVPVGTPEIGDCNPRESLRENRRVYDLTVEVALEPGLNTIGIAAFDRRQTILSEAGAVEIRADYAASRKGKPVLHVLAASITDYQDNPDYDDLSYPDRDARAIAELFTGQKTGSLYADVKVKSISGKEVTRQGLRKTFNDLKKQISPEDTFVFFYAGHGDVDGRKDFFLVPWDAAAGELIEKADIVDGIAKIRAKNTLVLLDTCRSGALVDMQTAFGRLWEKMEQKAILVAASGEQSAVEAGTGDTGHGVFTKTLLETALKGSAEDERWQPVGRIMAYVKEEVPREVRRMQEGGLPERAGTRGGTREDFILQEPLAKLPAEDFPLLDRHLEPGELTVSTASEGSLIIEGAAGSRRERLAAGNTVKKRLPEKSYTAVMLYADGKREAYPFEMRNNSAQEVKFTYSVPVAAAPVTPPPAPVAVPPPPAPAARSIPEGFELKGTVLVKYTGKEENVVIPGGLGITEIGKKAFEDTKVKSITIPQGVTRIGNSAFIGCIALSSIRIPDSVTSIENGSFTVCNSLTSISIPAGVTSIGEAAFNICSMLSSISVESGNTAYASRDGVLYNKNFTTLVRYPQGKQGTDYRIPAGLARVGDYAFYGCAALASITIPDGVSSIGDYAFYSCAGLVSINIPGSVTHIGYSAFSRCAGLETVSLSRNTKFEDNSFPKSVEMVYRD